MPSGDGAPSAAFRLNRRSTSRAHRYAWVCLPYMLGPAPRRLVVWRVGPAFHEREVPIPEDMINSFLKVPSVASDSTKTPI